MEVEETLTTLEADGGNNIEMTKKKMEGVEVNDKPLLLYSFTESQHEMLERLSKQPSLVVKSQQRDEPDLSSEQKLDELKKVFSLNPEQFLVRFGNFLKLSELKCFDGIENSSELISFHLSELQKSLGEEATRRRLKNRRYEALKKLVETTDYFSEEEMQRRNPILFDQLIGKYHTDQEREAFLQQSYKSSSGSGTTSMPLTDLFLAHLERTSEGLSCRRLAQESQQDAEDEADAEYEDDDNSEDEDMETPRRKLKKRLPPTVNDDDANAREEIEDEEKDLFKEEFFTTMYHSFLNGKDEDFDYSTVDDNPEYDCGENLENDEEDKYFDEEEPAQLSEPNSEQDDHLFKPPVRSNEIESKIEKLSVKVNHSEESSSENTSQQTVSSSNHNGIRMDDDEEEDSLDAYMREIEKQL